MSGVTPHTSSAYCSSTNTPAFSSLAPSNLRNSQTSSSEADGARSSTSNADSGEPDHAAEEIQLPSLPTTGNTSDSIIEFRRGARTSSGQLSFSISVHTASGRTIHFDNTDFEGSDDDDDVHVDRQSGLITIRRGNNPTPDRDLDQQESSEEDSDEEFLENDPLEDDMVRYEHNAGENMDHYSDNDSDDDIGNNANDNAEQNIGDSPQNLPANSTASQEGSSPLQSAIFRQPLTGTAPGISQSGGSSSSSDNQSTSDSNSTGAQSGDNSNQSSSVGFQSTSGTQSSTGSQARNNSLYFVLQSNTQGRRVLNLTYMDRYSAHEKSELQKKIHMNAKRLIGYAEECNVGRGFIKEVGFNADGRLICSPFGFGVRLFAFDSDCHELCDCVPASPVKLYEVTCSLAHCNCVVATKFSPTQNMVVSGCLDGKIAFHQPVL